MEELDDLQVGVQIHKNQVARPTDPRDGGTGMSPHNGKGKLQSMESKKFFKHNWWQQEYGVNIKLTIVDLFLYWQAKKTLKQLDDMGHKGLPSINQFTTLFAKVSCS